MLLKEAFDMLDEAANKSLSRIQQHVQDRNIGIITAHRGENSAEENKRRNHELAGHIRNNGFGFVHIRGKYIENKGEANEKHGDEHSYLVIGKKGNDNGHLKGFLTKHGEKYGQDSILHKSHNDKTANLIGTRDGDWLKKGEHMNVGDFHPNMVGDYHSALRRGTPRSAPNAYSVSDHTGKDVKSFNTKKEAKAHLETGLKNRELEHGSKVKFNARSFAFLDKVGPVKPQAGTFNKMSKKGKTNEEVVEEFARALFESRLHRHPDGNIPDWNRQPDHIKQSFLDEATLTLEETKGVFEDFNFWAPTTWFNRQERLWEPTDNDLESL